MRDSTYDYGEQRSATQAEERVVLVGGDLRGTARAAAFAFAKSGNHIVLASENDDAGLELARQLRARNVDVAVLHADTHTEAGIRDAVAQTVARYGHLDVQYLQ